jgi:hypothetical protein
MNIPLDRLYHFINNIASKIYGDRVLIYRFYPHGSKNIYNLNKLDTMDEDKWRESEIAPFVWCNDQEPLDYEFYKTHIRDFPDNQWMLFLKNLGVYHIPKNLNYRRNIFKKTLLLHSEKRSLNLKKYEFNNELIPVYYWSHAVIAQDWFRYAKHETFQKQTQKTFLIYNRAWSNTREYRLKFTEILIQLNLQDYCLTAINPIEADSGIHYREHEFKNPIWSPKCLLENYFPINCAKSHYSADFDAKDYNATDIEVVLETLFDDDRLHLTEKSLRPIACGQPFILAGTHGSLEYLRSYGFKTFGDVWDEHYDLIEDPEERLHAITDLMQKISNWDPIIRKHKLAQARSIADYNRQWFNNQKFFDQLIDELKYNLSMAFNELNLCDNQSWVDRWNHWLTHKEIIKFLETNQNPESPTTTQVQEIFKIIQDRLKKVATTNN